MGESKRGGGQGGCERRIEVLGKIQKKNLGGGVWEGGGVGLRLGGGRVTGGGGVQGGCERRISFCENSKKKLGGGGSVGGGGGGWVGGGRVRVDVNAMLGVGGDVGYGGCEPRVEGIVQGTKRYCTILRKLKQVAQRATMLT